jgi:2-hydroxy-6-oxonona-2,4-dienedioate hydrolase
MSETDPRRILDGLLARCTELRSPCGEGALVWRAWGPEDSPHPPVVLLHGGFGAWNHWVRTIPALEGEYRVIAGDLPGCGDSANPPQRPYEAADLAALLSDGIDVVVPGDAPFDLVSFSFGGVLSGLIAHAHARRIRQLVIVGSPITGLIATGPANDLVPVPRSLPLAEAKPLYRGNLEKLMVHDPAAVDDLAMTLHMDNMAKARLRSRHIARTGVLADSLRNLPCRLACIFGEADVTLKPDLAGVRAYVEEIHPGAPFHVVPGVGHWVQYEAADAFNALLPQVLNG